MMVVSLRLRGRVADARADGVGRDVAAVRGAAP